MASYKLHFSTYQTRDDEATNVHRSEHLEEFLSLCFEYCKIQGATIESMRGYWAGEFEPSHAVTLYDISKTKAEALAKQLQQVFNQDEIFIKSIN